MNVCTDGLVLDGRRGDETVLHALQVWACDNRLAKSDELVLAFSTEMLN